VQIKQLSLELQVLERLCPSSTSRGSWSKPESVCYLFIIQIQSTLMDKEVYLSFHAYHHLLTTRSGHLICGVCLMLNTKKRETCTYFPVKAVPLSYQLLLDEILSMTSKSLQIHKFFSCQAELEAIAPYFDTIRNWRERYEILGGIPRHVFGKKNPNKLLQVACNKYSLDDCINIVGSDSEITEMSKVSHFLIHTTSLYPFTDSSLTFASRRAFDLIVEQRGREVKKRIEELMESCDRNPLTAALC